MTELELLRLHINAVWNLHLPLLSYDDSALAVDEAPPWAVYLGMLSGGHVRIWRRDISGDQRARLAERALAALALPTDVLAGEGIRREVALRRVEATKMDSVQAWRIARRLTAADVALLESYETGSSAYFLVPERAPLFGVVEADRLVSIAHSSRRTAEACELGVHSLPEARRHGYGLAVTSLWTEAIAAEGVEPLYSALAENAASLALAHAAGYRPFVYGASVMPTHPPAPAETTPHR